MPRSIDDIIVPEKRRSIRDIPIPADRRKSSASSRPSSIKVPVKKATLADFAMEEEEAPVQSQRNPDFPRRKRMPKKNIWIAIGVAGVILLFGILSIFNGATFAYVPKSAVLTFNNETYTAQKTGTSGLFYSVVKLSRDKGLAAPAGGAQAVSRKASGTIVVYNNASADPQTLIGTTRFETTDGKIYRIQNAITIPGKKTVSGAAAPGTIEVTVYADQPGDSYNAPLSDFTLPGLKGTPRYSTIYARSKTPLTGGFVGQEKVVNPGDLASAKTALEAALKDELWTEVQAEVPNDFILFPSLSSYIYEDLPQTPSTGSDGSVTVNLRGNLYGVMFKKSDLSSYLAVKKLNLSATEPVDIPSFSSLNITFAGAPPADLLTLNQVNLNITGTTTVLWRTDETALKADLVGRGKGDISGILKNYPAITSASVTVRPFWKSSLPTDVSKITINKLPPK